EATRVPFLFNWEILRSAQVIHLRSIPPTAISSETLMRRNSGVVRMNPAGSLWSELRDRHQPSLSLTIPPMCGKSLPEGSLPFQFFGEIYLFGYLRGKPGGGASHGVLRIGCHKRRLVS